MAPLLVDRATAVVLLVLACATRFATSATLSYNISVELATGNPDCWGSRLLFTANGKWPGPTIECVKGDTVRITVTNNLFQENAGIHWHGIKQRGTPYFDGVPGVSQCPIPPGGSVTYTLDTSYSQGTYWYHSHYFLQNVAALYGPIIIRPKDKDDRTYLGYNEELAPMMLGDWFHQSLNEQAHGLDQAPTTWVGDPAAALINGRGIFECVPTATSQCQFNSSLCGYPVINVVKGRRYRLRIINAAAYAYFNFAIAGHSPLTIVETDGNYVAPVNVTSLDINAGQTYSVLFTANQPVANYWINTRVQYLKANLNVRGAAILRYQGARAAWPTAAFLTTHPTWNDTSFMLAQQKKLVHRSDFLRPPPATVNRAITMVLQETLVNGVLKESVNNKTLQVPTTPLVLQQAYGLLNNNINFAFDQPSRPYDYTKSLCAQNITQNGDSGTIMYTTLKDQVIQVVVQNTVNCRNASSAHPWHLHGHDFWEIGMGLGNYNARTSPATFNLKNPIMRNTISLPPVGWTAIRFKTDNPGIWLFHCHNSYHLEMGMGVVFNVAPRFQPRLPNNTRLCGDITIGMRPLA